MPPVTHQEIAGVYDRINAVEKTIGEKMERMEDRLTAKIDDVGKTVATSTGRHEACYSVVMGDSLLPPIKDVVSGVDRESRQRDETLGNRVTVVETHDRTRSKIDYAILGGIVSLVFSVFKWGPDLVNLIRHL